MGAVSGVLGIALAVAQQDLKRLLAYSSIENIGIIVIGVGLASLGRSLGRADLVVLGLGGALLHVLNHSLFKPLLFLAAGSVLHATGTRRISSLGGLARTMPYTFVLFTVGAVAICGLPPLNGFASELLLYLGLLRVAAVGPVQPAFGLGEPRGSGPRDHRCARAGGLRQGHGHRLRWNAPQPGRRARPRSRPGHARADGRAGAGLPRARPVAGRRGAAPARRRRGLGSGAGPSCAPARRAGPPRMGIRGGCGS